MAQGTFTLFEEFRKTIADGSHDLDSDSFKVMLIDDTTIAVAATASPDSGDFTEVSGTGYTAGGEAITCTYTEAAGVATFAVSSGNTVWSQNGAGPTDIEQAIIYNTSHAGTNDAIGFIDMTADAGVTPISLQDGDITITWNPTLFTLT